MSLFSKKQKPQFRTLFLSDENRKLRIILLCVFLAIAFVAFTVGLVDYLNVDPGWQEVEVLVDKTSCSGDFTFQYYFSNSGASATAVNKELVALYTEWAEQMYWLFTPDEPAEGMENLYSLNQKVNQPVTVDPVLYNAFALLEESGSRSVYLAPAYAFYDNLFFAQDTMTGDHWDPAEGENAQYLAQIAAFAGDPLSIQVVLQGENQLMLQISEEYLAFAAEHEITEFVDFHWMRNAFIIDYFADQCRERGYTQGFFVSRDGFTRNLNSGVDFSFNLFNRVDSTIYPAGAMTYREPMSIVFYHDYPMSDWDSQRYFGYPDGRILSSYVDIADGQSRSAAGELISYSETLGCAELMLKTAPVYVADSLDTQQLRMLTGDGIDSVWFEGRTICHTQADLVLTNLLNGEDAAYTAKYVN